MDGPNTVAGARTEGCGAGAGTPMGKDRLRMGGQASPLWPRAIDPGAEGRIGGLPCVEGDKGIPVGRDNTSKTGRCTKCHVMRARPALWAGWGTEGGR